VHALPSSQSAALAQVSAQPSKQLASPTQRRSALPERQLGAARDPARRIPEDRSPQHTTDPASRPQVERMALLRSSWRHSARTTLSRSVGARAVAQRRYCPLPRASGAHSQVAASCSRAVARSAASPASSPHDSLLASEGAARRTTTTSHRTREQTFNKTDLPIPITAPRRPAIAESIG
jgi:hypothetical protein